MYIPKDKYKVRLNSKQSTWQPKRCFFKLVWQDTCYVLKDIGVENFHLDFLANHAYVGWSIIDL